MLPVLGRRIATGFLTLFLVSVLVFLLIHLAPGSPLAESIDAGSSRRLDPKVREELERIYHLDQPLHIQYWSWLRGALAGDLGRSFHDRRPVVEKIGERLGVSVTLNGLALLAMVMFLPVTAPKGEKIPEET